MTDYIFHTCGECQQQLRIPKKIGGMLMACPSCGKTFYSDFKIAANGRRGYKRAATAVYEMPYTLWKRLGRLLRG